MEMKRNIMQLMKWLKAHGTRHLPHSIGMHKKIWTIWWLKYDLSRCRNLEPGLSSIDYCLLATSNNNEKNANENKNRDSLPKKKSLNEGKKARQVDVWVQKVKFEWV